MTKMTKARIKRSPPPAVTLEGREQQLIGYAIELAEKQLQEGTASSQVITHFLKESSLRTQLELEKIKQENLLLKAKTDAIRSGRSAEELYAEAIRAMRRYQGDSQDDEDV